MIRNTYKPGENIVICDMCGEEKYRSQCRKNWKRQLVCTDTCYEPKHPQLSVKSKPDLARPSDVRPIGEDVFLEPGDVTQDDL